MPLTSLSATAGRKGYSDLKIFLAMSEPPELQARVRKVTEVFDEMQRAGSSNQEIFAEAYDGLKQLARKLVAKEHPGGSMCASRLVSDLWVKLFERPPAEFKWQSGAHFFHFVTMAMHNLLITHARTRNAEKRGGGRVGSLDELHELGLDAPHDGQAPKNKNWFNEAADRALAWEKAFEMLPLRLKQTLYLSCYAGYKHVEIAELLGVSVETVKKDFVRIEKRMNDYRREGVI
jgi:RNA polymerase sigma-70 factor, ECF subfamily